LAAAPLGAAAPAGIGSETIAKLFLLQFVIFIQYFVKLARHDFHRNNITPQTLALAFLVLNKNP
jgi:hypothetical protein